MGSRPEGKTQAIDVSAMVLEIVSEMSGVTAVGPDAELVAELGFDSLGLVELVVALEDTLGLPPVDVEALGKMDRVADLQCVVREAQARISSVRTPE
jgi:acyl carrier protein